MARRRRQRKLQTGEGGEDRIGRKVLDLVVDAGAFEQVRVPPVVADSGGTRELVVHGVTGLKFAPSREDCLANALLTLVTDGELRRKLGENGRRLILSRFTSAECARQIGCIYNDVLRADAAAELQPGGPTLQPPMA